MEGIGVKDKNGKEIKKFDIVDFIVDRWSNGTFIVVQISDSYYLQGIDDLDDRIKLGGKLIGELEIIGGLYAKHPEPEEPTI